MALLTRPRLTLRVRLLLLVLFALVPAFALLMRSARIERLEAERAAEAGALRLARSVALDQERRMEGSQQLLAALARVPEIRGERARDCPAFLRDLLRQYALYANFGVARPDGTIFCSAVPLKGEVNIADRAYFRGALDEGRFTVGEHQVGRVTGRATINFGYPVLDDAGRRVAVVFAALDLAWLARDLASTRLPEHTVLLLFDRRGTVLARQPEEDHWHGRRFPDSPLLDAAVSAGEGARRVAGFDGVERLYGFTPLRPGTDVVSGFVAVGLPPAALEARLAQLQRRNLAAISLVALVVLLLAWVGGDLFVLRPVGRLVRTTRRLAHGDLSARTGLPPGPAELNHLATAIDEMAGALEARERELAAAMRDKDRLVGEVREAAQLRDEFLSAAAHELRTPATVLKGAVQALLRRAPRDDSDRRLLAGIRASAERTARLARELIEVHRLSTGALELARLPLDFAALATRAARGLGPLLPRHRFVACAAGPVPLLGDAELLSLAVSALLENAARSEPEGGRVHLTIGSQSDHATLEVRDFGVGIPPDRLERIFEPLFEPWPPGSPHYIGVVGLGLYLARAVLEAHGGSIAVESGVGTGSTFRVELPLAPAEHPAPRGRAPGAAATAHA